MGDSAGKYGDMSAILFDLRVILWAIAGLGLVYLAARIATIAYFRSKQDFNHKE